MYDLSPLLADPSHGILSDPIVTGAGQDLSHWFDAATGDVKTYIDPATNLRAPYTPQGKFIHVPSITPSTTETVETLVNPWWKQETYVIGVITAKARKVRVINTLTSHEHIVDFGIENTIEDMQRRYLEFNAHCGSYAWKALLHGEFRPLDVHKTLAENGIPDDANELETLGLDEEDKDMLVTLLLVFTDDLTIA